jgi:hypothetical protein
MGLCRGISNLDRRKIGRSVLALVGVFKFYITYIVGSYQNGETVPVLGVFLRFRESARLWSVDATPSGAFHMESSPLLAV